MPGKLGPRKLSIHDARIAGLYDLEHTIGKGHFAVVKLAKHVFTGEKVAVKVIDKTKLDPVSQSHMMQEVRCMKLVQHPNIVRLYEVIDTSSKLFLILELGDYDMFEYIMRNENKGIKESDAQQYFSQIIKAIDYCHTLHVVHRDLKPENVVFFEKLGMVKLTDFGFSNLFTPGQQLQTSCGSLAYSAPEILLGDAYDAPAVDVWSLGVILYMLVCGRLPFQETNESETLTKILDCRYVVPDYVSQPCKQLIGRMLVRDPSKRATLFEIVQFSWVIAGDRGHAEILPLIVKDQLPVSAHSTIIDQMVAGGIATEEDIITAIDNDDYSYITATYYLLAERVLASYREEQANRLLLKSNKEDELSEFGDPATVSSTGSTTPNYHSRSRSNSWRGSTSRRACTILKEESEEELSTYMKSSRQSSRNSSPSVSMFSGNLLNSSRDRISPQAIHDLLEFSRLSSGMKRAASPDSRISSRSPSPNSSGRTSPAISASFMKLKVTVPSGSGGMRKLSSSPHLLGICEEGEDGNDVPAVVGNAPRSVSTIPHQKGPHLGRGNRSASIGFTGSVSLSKSSAPLSKDETTYSSVRVIRPRQAVVSPDMARRYDQHQRFVSRSRRSTSCSSSETSDDDSNERKLNLIGSKYCRRNPEDKNNDDDGTGGGGGSHGPKRSNSMKEQTILEEPPNSEKQSNENNCNNKGTQDMAKGYPDSPCSSRSIYSESDISVFSRQICIPLQPILEHDSLPRISLFNRSSTAKEALHDWLQESLNFKNEFKINDEPESPTKIRWCCHNDPLTRYGDNFYRPLRRSKSIELDMFGFIDDEDLRNYSRCSDVNEDSQEMDLLSMSGSSRTTDSGCSSDDERRNKKSTVWLSEFTNINNDLEGRIPLVISGVVK